MRPVVDALPSVGATVDEPAWLARTLDRWLAWGLAWMGVLLALFPVYRLREPALRAHARDEQRVTYAALGAHLYALHCQGCHGAGGGGLGAFPGAAPTLRAREFLRAVSDTQVTWLVAGGVPGTAMPAWAQDLGGPLTPEQVRQVVTYVRTWERDAPSVPAWRTGARARP